MGRQSNKFLQLRHHGLEVLFPTNNLYTNHSIRATSITTLDSNDIAARHIQAVSGHKSEATIRTYSKYCPPKKKKQMFDLLTIDTTTLHCNANN